MARTKHAVKKGTQPRTSTKAVPLLFDASGSYRRLHEWPSGERFDYAEASEAFISSTLGCLHEEWRLYDERWENVTRTGQERISYFCRFKDKAIFLRELHDGDDRLCLLPMSSRQAWHRLFSKGM